MGGMVPYGSGSIRHTGHSRRGERPRLEAAADDRRSEIERDETSEHKDHRARASNRPSARPGVQTRTHKGRLDEVLFCLLSCETDDGTEPRGEKHKATDTSEEIRLLEANKRRLLTQQDWVGIDPSKPVNLRFLSNKEKEKIGKRRRITGKHGAALRQNNDAGIGEPQLNPRNKFAGHFERGNNIDNIRIRIGTDASTNTYSTQTNDHVQSQASSDPMLFDQEGPDAQQHAKVADFAPPVNLQSREARSMSRQTSATPHAHPLTGEKAPRYHDVARLHGPIPSQDTSEQGSSTNDQLELHTQNATSMHQERESSSEGFRLTHRVQGDERSVHLVFGDSNSPVGDRGRIMSEDSDIGETQPPRGPYPARAFQIDQMHQISNDREQSAIDETSAALAIVDEEPWKTYLAISDGRSSHSDTAIIARNSMLHDHPTARNNNEAVTNWSQHATQGDQSHISLSSVSASLPSLRRGIRLPLSARPYGGDANRRGVPVDMRRQALDEDERNWQAFVFGSDNNSSSQNHASEAPRLKYSENTSSRYLPLSAAVSTVSPPPRNTRFGSYISNDVQDSETSAPPSKSRATSSPAFHQFVDDLSDGGFGEDNDERNVVDVHSVTQASLQNNASASDLISSRISSRTKTSRSNLDRHRPARATSYAQGTSSRRIARSSSIYDIPVSDDEALHLVDPDETEWG
jgi:hypothetical protein